MTETVYQEDQLTATLTFTNKSAGTAEQFKSAITTVLASVANNPQGEIVLTIDNGSTGVIIGNG